MTQYIDKAALVAEIKRRISLFKKEKKTEKWSAGASQMNVVSLGARIAMLEEILSFFNTLEVKEVDLENYVHGTVDYPIIGSDFPNIYPNYKELKDYCDKNRIMDNDKVKLIIVKEDMP